MVSQVVVTELGAFRLGDIRGIFPTEINEQFVCDFAHAFVGHFPALQCVATGRDTRESGKPLQQALNNTLASIGIRVVDMGLCATEVGYFASSLAGIDAAIVVTASHNPPAYNGLKCVLANGIAVTAESGLQAVQQLMAAEYRHPPSQGKVNPEDVSSHYRSHLARTFAKANLHAGDMALNGLNGTAATLADEVASQLGLPVTWYRKEPGSLPAGGADPVTGELAAEMKDFMGQGNYALGVAWDGDCDRCVFFDEAGRVVPAYYLIGLLAEYFLTLRPGSAIAFDAKLKWNTLAVIQRCGGRPVVSRTGHAYMKQCMHESGAVYGGELSSHHYFSDFNSCDSGMYAWLTVLQMLQHRGNSLGGLIEEARAGIACTPEISFPLAHVDRAFDEVVAHFQTRAVEIEQFEGLGVVMPGDWRFSLMRSKTEPVVRLNFESRGDPDVLLDAGREVFSILEPYRADKADWMRTFQIQ